MWNVRLHDCVNSLKLTKDLLIIFIKNPIKGKVKTRLAQDLGEEMALKIYRKLVDRTLRETSGILTEKLILFSDFLERSIVPSDGNFSSGMQTGKDLGERMKYAFIEGFKLGYQHICLIGTDCYEISAQLILEAFDQLHLNDIVLGPANDGGYYLVGMNTLLEDIFLNKPWGTSAVLKRTLQDIDGHRLSCFLLRELIDVDTKKDLELLNINPEIFVRNES